MPGLSGTIKAKPRGIYAAGPIRASLSAARAAPGSAKLRAREGTGMTDIVLKALRAGLIGLVLGPLFGLIWVTGLMIFDPKCSGPGDSGGCAMGLLTVPAVLIAPSFVLFATVSLARNLWRVRPRDLAGAIRRLRNWGRED